MKAASSLMKGMLGGSSADSGSGESSSASPIRKALTVAEMHEQASGALVNLGACAENRISIVEKGAIPQLVARIKNAGSAAAAMSMISDITEEETATSLRASIESEMKADDTDLIATVTARTQINCARALAVLCLNDSAIGIEHEGFGADYQTWYTDAMYEESAKLSAWLANQYLIPIDREHIIGHDESGCTTHRDPGPGWDWPKYMGLIEQYAERSGGASLAGD